MYDGPRLERLGTFREMTAQSGKTSIGDDAIPGIGNDCNPDPNSGANACRS